MNRFIIHLAQEAKLIIALCVGANSFFLIAAAAVGDTGAFGSSSPHDLQCIFDPGGYFYVSEKMPRHFEDIDHLILMEKQGDGTGVPFQGLCTAQGKVYRFTAIEMVVNSFEFSTVTISGVSYSFTGRFNYPCIFEEFYAADKNQDFIAVEGKLLKFVDGKRIAETPARFTYRPKSRDLMNEVNAPYPSGRTDLFYAARKGDLASMRDLIGRGADINVRDKQGHTALAFGLRSLPDRVRLLEVARLLIAAGANVNLKDKNQTTPLMMAVYRFDDREGELVKSLLSAGADANARDEYGTTVLMHAAHAADQVADLIGNVRELIRASAQVNARNKSGQTALSIAMESRNDELINLLREAGAKP